MADNTNIGECSIADVPGCTYRITRGTPDGGTGYPSNWHTLEVIDADGNVVAALGFSGP